jgi:hypothetical protein
MFLERLIIQSSELHHPRHPLRHRIDSMDTHLLGAVSRAGFSEYPCSKRAQETIVKGVQTIESADTGFLTKKERRHINIEAWQQAAVELDRMNAEAEARGEVRGEANGRRATLLAMAERLSPGAVASLQGD